LRLALETAVANADDLRKVRLLVAEDGQIRTETYVLAPEHATARVCLATRPIDSSDIFFFHKTTHRAEYDRHRCADCDDVILWNHAGEVTESTTANIVVEVDGQTLTPPVSSGLLAGTLRARLLQEGRIAERIVTLQDLKRSSRVWLINSVRGSRAVDFVIHDRQTAEAAHA
jgi:branched-subunit amino acid aminotransferase/4-amino-4-deoxychorismate lyase